MACNPTSCDLCWKVFPVKRECQEPGTPKWVMRRNKIEAAAVAMEQSKPRRVNGNKRDKNG